MPKVSVIVPVYNVEKYIERCAVSLFEQTLDDIEYIFVNDYSLDNSVAVLKKVLKRYPQRETQVKIINNDENKGLSLSRNVGLEIASGDYITFCDSDDWVEADFFNEMYSKALESDADITVCDFVHEFSDRCKTEQYEPITNSRECIEYDKRPVWWTVWNRLIKRSLIIDSNVRFIAVALEDVCWNMMLYYYADHIAYVSKPLYHYNRVNEGSILYKPMTKAEVKRRVQLYNVLEQFFNDRNFPQTIITKYKINLKDKHLLQGDFCFWKQICPEVVPIVVRDKSLKYGYRFCYAMAAKGFTIPMRLYMWVGSVVNKIRK